MSYSLKGIAAGSFMMATALMSPGQAASLSSEDKAMFTSYGRGVLAMADHVEGRQRYDEGREIDRILSNPDMNPRHVALMIGGLRKGSNCFARMYDFKRQTGGVEEASLYAKKICIGALTDVVKAQIESPPAGPNERRIVRGANGQKRFEAFRR